MTQTITFLVFVALSEPGVSEAEIEAALLSASENGRAIAIHACASAVVCGLLLAVVIKLRRGATIPGYLALRSVSARAAIRWVAAVAVFGLVSDAIRVLLGRPVIPEFMEKTYLTADPVWTFWIALLIAAPLIEEAFFRGFLLPGLSVSFIGPAGAVLLTSAGWAAVHAQYDAYDMATVFVMGLILGGARVSTRSVLLPLGLHSLFNLAALIQTVFLLS